MKVSAILSPASQRFFVASVGLSLLFAPKVPAQAITSAAIASPASGQVTTGVTGEVERVIVTGSNIPTAAETGPNPVDTYRPADIEKWGVRNATDLQTFLPQQAGGTTNLNMLHSNPGSSFCFRRRSWRHHVKTPHTAAPRIATLATSLYVSS